MVVSGLADKTSTITMSSSPPSVVGGGFRRWRREIFQGFAALSAIYGLVYWRLDHAAAFLEPAPEFCTSSNEPCTRPDLFSFQVAAQFAQVFLGVTGLMAWHVTRAAHTGVPATPEGRLFGVLPVAERLCAGIIVFQAWDFCFSLMIPEHATAVFLTHHVLSGLTAYFSLEYGIVHHYAIFFGGVSWIVLWLFEICMAKKLMIA